jgi:hypothetical protein
VLAEIRPSHIRTLVRNLKAKVGQGRAQKLLAGLTVLSEILKTAKAAAGLRQPIHDLIEWAARLMS